LETGQSTGESSGAVVVVGGGCRFGAQGEGLLPSKVILQGVAQERHDQMIIGRGFGSEAEAQLVLHGIAELVIAESDRTDGLGRTHPAIPIRPEDQHSAARCRVQLSQHPVALALGRPARS